MHNDLNVSVQVHADLDLRRFPFDHQRLELVIESSRWLFPLVYALLLATFSGG